MNRIIATFAIVFVLTIRSGEGLSCYECDSLQNKDCSEDPKKHGLELVECSLNRMDSLYRKMQRLTEFKNLTRYFEVDTPNDYSDIKMACAKADIKIHRRDVTIRNCQVAKSATLDPCNVLQTTTKTKFCGLCESDACNGSTVTTPNFIYSILFSLGYILLRGVGCYGA